jgi:hypothetical protein
VDRRDTSHISGYPKFFSENLRDFLQKASDHPRALGEISEIIFMSTIELREFKRNDILVILLLVNAFLFGLVGFLNLIHGKSGIGFVWFMASSLWFLNFFWSKRTPYIRMTKDDIILFPAMARRPKIVKWDSVQKFNQISKKKVGLLLLDGGEVEISLLSIDKKDRENLIQTFKHAIQDKSQQVSRVDITHMPTIEPREFKSRTDLVILLGVAAFVNTLAAVGYFIKTGLQESILHSIAAVILFFGFIHFKKIPYIRITKDEIVIGPGTLRKKIVKWNTLDKFERIDKKNLVLLHTTGGGKFKILLSFVNKEDRGRLIRIFQQGIKSRKNSNPETSPNTA